MTEAEWLACTDSQPMLEFLRGKASERKLRLFSCACHFRVWDRIPNEDRRIILKLEQLADGQATYQELNRVYRKASGGIYDAPHFDDCETALCDAWSTADKSDDPDAEAVAQAALLQCIFGNPFRPVKLRRAWLTWNDSTIPKLAQAIYDQRAFDRLPILADALEEASCTNADILNHCRQPGEHVRGCWVVDAILGKA